MKTNSKSLQIRRIRGIRRIRWFKWIRWTRSVSAPISWASLVLTFFVISNRSAVAGGASGDPSDLSSLLPEEVGMLSQYLDVNDLASLARSNGRLWRKLDHPRFPNLHQRADSSVFSEMGFSSYGEYLRARKVRGLYPFQETVLRFDRGTLGESMSGYGRPAKDCKAFLFDRVAQKMALPLTLPWGCLRDEADLTFAWKGWGGLEELTLFHPTQLSNSEFTDIFSRLRKLPKLKKLKLQFPNHRFVESTAKALGILQHLESLDLEFQGIGAQGLGAPIRLTGLKALRIKSGICMDFVTPLIRQNRDSLEAFGFESGIESYGSALGLYGALSELKRPLQGFSLDFRSTGNPPDDVDWTELGNFLTRHSHLKTLELSGIPVSDPLPKLVPALSQMLSLKKLTLRGSPLGGVKTLHWELLLDVLHRGGVSLDRLEWSNLLVVGAVAGQRTWDRPLRVRELVIDQSSLSLQEAQAVLASFDREELQSLGLTSLQVLRGVPPFREPGLLAFIASEFKGLRRLSLDRSPELLSQEFDLHDPRPFPVFRSLRHLSLRGFGHWGTWAFTEWHKTQYIEFFAKFGEHFPKLTGLSFLNQEGGKGEQPTILHRQAAVQLFESLGPEVVAISAKVNCDAGIWEDQLRGRCDKERVLNSLRKERLLLLEIEFSLEFGVPRLLMHI